MDILITIFFINFGLSWLIILIVSIPIKELFKENCDDPLFVERRFGTADLPGIKIAPILPWSIWILKSYLKLERYRHVWDQKRIKRYLFFIRFGYLQILFGSVIIIIIYFLTFN